MMKTALSLFLAASLSLAGLSAGAQVLPNVIVGAVPGGAQGVAHAVLEDASGKQLSMVSVTQGKFAFRDLAPGDYYVVLHDASGHRIARSCAVSLASGVTRETSFDCPAAPALGPGSPAATAPSAATQAGIGAPREFGATRGILMGAAVIGFTAAVVIATDDDEGVASAIR